MAEWKARRFWKSAGVRQVADGWEVTLDDRPLRTPGKLALVLPTERLAKAVADEWDAQADMIDPNTMPLTRAANSAVEKVAPQFDAVADMLAEYGGTDLLCYRTDAPAALAERQETEWQPLLDWAADRYGARLAVTQGLMPVAQDSAALSRLRAALAGLDTFGLTALHDLVALPGSLVLGLAVIEGRLDADAAFALSRLDEDHQAEQWGRDDEAEAAASAKAGAMQVAERVWLLSRPHSFVS
ncbi:MAG: ATP12 family protein [Paracoccus sp. (in: a-proteobacteria)]|uniref:ATP12 family chaperone protein n=1 Tax=Paracoccus sp. TaxID=267 RepID=UPI0026DF7D6F|nr:ATP12 family protein [Paracoccus sp. (in: a-proteobacteria)]MDO5620724.1 ATP12 family protein [Paracoccus sp. (in: a-proteobacteria)]